MPTPGESERARAAVSVAALRWLRSEVEAAHPPPGHVVRERRPDRLPYHPPGRPDPAHHPLYDRWIDG